MSTYCILTPSLLIDIPVSRQENEQYYIYVFYDFPIRFWNCSDRVSFFIYCYQLVLWYLRHYYILLPASNYDIYGITIFEGR